MSVLEIVFGVLLILCSIAIILMVLFQESKGRGLSGVIGGGENGENSRTPNALLAKLTRYAAIAFFVLAITVSIISAAMN